MSTTKHIILFCCVLLQAATANVFAQSHPILGMYSAFEIEGRIYLSWSIIAGSTCDGIQIYRSTDSVNYMKIGRIYGVCGSVDFVESYEFTDNNPVKNKINYYRLELGNQGFTQPVSVDIIDIERTGYQIRPHPANAETAIYYDNSTKQEQRITLSNLNGIEVFTTTTEENFFRLNAAFLQSGIYLFTISVTGKPPTVQGRLLVQH